jgi:hypothetical protein
MKRTLALAVLALLPLALPAETLDLGPRGVFGITLPKGWKMSSEKEGDSGYAVTVSPPGNENAKLLINLAMVPNQEPVPKEQVQEQVLAICDQFVEKSVEKKKVLRELGMPGGAYACYCVFTDASMVGKPPEKDNFKVIGIGIMKFSDDLMAAFSIDSDDEKGPEFAAMLAAAASAVVTPKK